MNTFKEPAPLESINAAIAALKKNGMDAQFASTGTEAKQKVLDLLPQGAEVMTMTSVTLDTLGVAEEINGSGKYAPVRDKLNAMDRATQGPEMQKLGAAPDWAIGSVHAITEDGSVFTASNTGSQLPAYAYGSNHVVWVVGAQKIVKDKEEALRRIYDYVLPLESERAKKAYGVEGSNVSKLLIVNEEIKPERIQVIIVGEPLGY